MNPGLSIAHYCITSKLGEGGMGEVRRATDTKLNRDVAIKILPDAFANDPDRMARFTREAQVLASLNHPNIAAIYGVEERALVMELVEGETLPGGLPPETALNYARQIAEALEYAHERGVVHRDLKPANIKVTPEGKVKVLDFGLALVTQASAGSLIDPMSSPTRTMGATLAGTILGTVAYMSPEQARGQTADRRADIWAFGAVLHEMLTDRPLFARPTMSDTLAAVLKGEVDVSAIPAEVRPVVERCLRREPRQRWQAIGDVRMLLEEGLTAAQKLEQRRSPVPWTVAAILAVTAVAMSVGWWRTTRRVDPPLLRLSVDLGPDAMTGLNLTAAISPDGRRLAFPARGPDGSQQLATRLLDQALVTFLPGTENGADPFFSPDGQWIGFFARTQIKKVAVGGGAPVTLGSAVSSAMPGGSWGEDGNIVAAMGTAIPLSSLSGAGGQQWPLSRLGPLEITHRWPQVLPGGSAVLFTASSSAAGMDNADIEAISLKTGKVKVLQRGGYYGRYLPSGHLVYVHQGALFGVKFDPDRLEVRGSAVSLLDDLAANPVTGGGEFDFSRTGTFVYTPGKSAQSWQMAWLDSSGKKRALAAPGGYAFPRLSPDGRKLSYLANSGDLYVYDLERDTTSQLTGRGVSYYYSPLWTPDGKHIVFESGSSIYWMRSDGAGDPQRLFESPNSSRPWSFSPDGRRLAYYQRSPEARFEIWTLPLDLTDPDHPRPGNPEPFLRPKADEIQPRFSPDGRWIAYRSNESGSNEIYVRPFPNATAGRWQISSAGGLYALWSNNGRELFYETTDNRIMVVDYAVDGASFIPGKPRLWSEEQIFYTGTSNLDLAPDGKRFVVLSLPEAGPGEKRSVHVTMLLNFFDEVKRRIP